MPTPSYTWRLSEHGYELDADGHHNLDDLTDVDLAVTPVTTDVLTWDGTKWIASAPTGSPDADYLVGTAQAGLSSEIVVGTTPGGQLGGTWASPTVDASHSGSVHVALSESTPLVELGSGSAGIGTASSKDDHVHPASAGGGGGAAAFSGARVYRTADQSIAQNAQDAILFTAERYDTDAYHSTSTNTARFTVPAGYWHVGATIELDVTTGTNADMVVSLFFNGTDEIATARLSQVADASKRTPAITVSADWYAASAGYFTVAVFHTAASAAVLASASRSPEFWIHKLG